MKKIPISGPGELSCLAHCTWRLMVSQGIISLPQRYSYDGLQYVRAPEVLSWILLDIRCVCSCMHVYIYDISMIYAKYLINLGQSWSTLSILIHFDIVSDILWMVAKSCTTKRMVFQPTKSWDVYHRFQLVQDFATIHSSLHLMEEMVPEPLSDRCLRICLLDLLRAGSPSSLVLGICIETSPLT